MPASRSPGTAPRGAAGTRCDPRGLPAALCPSHITGWEKIPPAAFGSCSLGGRRDPWHNRHRAHSPACCRKRWHRAAASSAQQPQARFISLNPLCPRHKAPAPAACTIIAWEHAEGPRGAVSRSTAGRTQAATANQASSSTKHQHQEVLRTPERPRWEGHHWSHSPGGARGSRQHPCTSNPVPQGQGVRAGTTWAAAAGSHRTLWTRQLLVSFLPVPQLQGLMPSWPSAPCTWHRGGCQAPRAVPGHAARGRERGCRPRYGVSDISRHQSAPAASPACHCGRSRGCPSTKQVPSTSRAGRDHAGSQQAANCAGGSASCALLWDAAAHSPRDRKDGTQQPIASPPPQRQRAGSSRPPDRHREIRSWLD